MRLEDFVERGAAVKGLCEAFLAGAPIHATLLVGPSGVGKRTLAGLCGQSLFCTGAQKPCGHCPPCRRYLSGSHPDAHRIAEKKSIGVDEIRALTSALHPAAYEGGWKTVLIECAGAMTVQAQNSLLKTLEEPPSRTVFLLTAISTSQLLQTVLSRCRIVQVPVMPEQAVSAALRAKGIEPARAAELAALSKGSVGDALKMHADDNFWALKTRVEQAMKSVCAPSDVWNAVGLLKDDKGESARVCDLLEAALRGRMRALLENETPNTASVQSLARLLSGVMDMRKMLASNVPWHAALERFMLNFSEEGIQWQL